MKQSCIAECSGRDSLYRPIDFVRYRKPHVVSYPRHAIVLNPQHTQQQREVTQKCLDNDERSSCSSQDENDSASEDEEDPRRMDKTSFLCSSEELRQCMHLRWREVGPAGVGLVNLGNTCFMNAVLQAICYTPALSQYFSERFKVANTSFNAPFDFAYALGETIRQIMGSSRSNSDYSPTSPRGGTPKSAYRPGIIATRLPSLSKRFRIGTQSDAHEFTVQLLSACEKSILHRLVGTKKLEPRVALTTALFQICGGYLRSQVAWSAHDEIKYLKNAGKHQEATDLKLSLQQKASSEKNAPGKHHNHHPSHAEKLVSNTYDPMTVLHIELVGYTLEQSLEAFCEPEKLSGRCYATPREVNVHATKQMTIHIPPNVLMIHLKRFQNTGGKVSRHVRYPLELDLSPFTTESVERRQQSPKHQDKEEKNSSRGGLRYELNAICIHEGGSINHGHYYTVVRARNGMWYLCDDSRVYPVSVEKALSQQAYMLFYSRIPVEKVKVSKRPENSEKTASKRPSFEKGLDMLKSNTMVSEVWGEELSEGEVITHLRERQQKEVGAVGKKNDVNSIEDKTPRASISPLSFSLDEKVMRQKTQTKPYTWTGARTERDSSDDSDEDESNETNLSMSRKRTLNDKAKDSYLRLYPLQNKNYLSKEDNPRICETSKEPPQLSLPNVLRSSPSMKDDSVTTAAENIIKKRNEMNPKEWVRVRKVDPSSLVSRETLNNTSNSNGISIGHSSSAILHTGIHAVAKLHDHIAQTTPSTIQQRADAPKFQQRVRDPMWEMEMDRGRVKKVRSKASENESSQGDLDSTKKRNPFQAAASNRFDIRGRKIR